MRHDHRIVTLSQPNRKTRSSNHKNNKKKRFIFINLHARWLVRLRNTSNENSLHATVWHVFRCIAYVLSGDIGRYNHALF